MNLDRYHRQTLLPQIGVHGQARLQASRVLLVGCGALGSVIAEQLVRAGVGTLRIADRDIVELTNLQRQVLFDEADVREQTPKAVAAARRLERINSGVIVEPRVTDVHAGNVEELAGLEPGGAPCDLIMDGTDNVDTRYLLNDVAVKHSISWVYGACVGVEGRSLAMHPPETACLRCLFSEPPTAAELPTCDTAGVLGPAATLVASLQVAAALRLLAGKSEATEPLITVDLWQSRFRTISMSDAKRPDCVTCGQRRFEFLDSPSSQRSTSLCGRNSVQVAPKHSLPMDLKLLATKLSPTGIVKQTPYLLRCELHDPPEIHLSVFPDGRAIVHGTADLERARSIYARFVGS
jgi:adenylyltransferase/sulfurtransferase